MKTFDQRKTYTETLEVSFGALSPEKLAEVLQDGRVSAFLMYEHLLARYSNLSRAPIDYYPTNSVQLSDGQVMAVRMNTEDGTLLNLHLENGVSRRKHPDGYKMLQEMIAGYIIVDVTTAPEYRYAFVSNARIPDGGGLSCEDAQTVIDPCFYQ